MRATDFVVRPLGGPRVLVAEGDRDDSAALTAVLRLNGVDAREERDAAAALATAAEFRPVVLVLDLDLPGGDGCELIRRVRRLPNPPAVVVVTGHAADGVRRAATAAGASAYLLKPADPVELVRLVYQFHESA